MPTTHFRNGVSNAAVGSPVYDYGRLDPTSYVEFFDDFLTFDTADWTITKVGTGTQALSGAMATPGGFLVTTNSAAAPDSVYQQLVGEAFRFTAGKGMWFRIRFKVSDATQSVVMAGLAITDTTPTDATDGIFFLKADEAATVSLIIRKASTSTTVAAGSLVNDTITDLAFYYDPGANKISAFKDGGEIGSTTTL